MNEEILEVSIVMPCLNEAETLGACIKKAQETVRKHRLQAEVIVADNGSSDGSQEIAKALGVQVVSAPIQGYGAALMSGIQAARGKYIVMADADASYNFGAIFPFVEKLREGYDFVMGCRFPWAGGKIMPGAMPWSHRWLGTPVLSAIGRLFFRSPVLDFNCGLRAFRRNIISALDLRTTGMEFASEMIIKATLKGMKITEIPITLYKDGRLGKPHLSTWRDGWRHLRFMLLYSPRWLFLFPGCVLFLLGALMGGILLAGPLTIGGVGFDTNTLLVAAMAILIGFKLIVFALFAKVFATAEGLLPEDRHLTKIFKFLSLEVGIISGTLCMLIGLGLLSWGVLYWQERGFGPLSYPDSLRLVIPGVTALTLGVEIIFSNFFLSVLRLRRK